MNITGKKPLYKNGIALATSVILITVITYTVYAHAVKAWPFSITKQPTTTTNYSPPTKEQRNAAGSVQTKKKESPGVDTSPSSTTSNDSQQKQTVGMSITAADENAGTLYLRTLIQTISSSGTCSLSMTGPNNTNYSATAGVQVNPSSSTCQGFDIPVSSLSTGSWHVVISYSDGNVTASASKDISIQ